MPKIKIKKEKCKGCLLCINFCPKGLIRIERKLNRQGIKPVTFTETGNCSGCSVCAIICPDSCIEVWK